MHEIRTLAPVPAPRAVPNLPKLCTELVTFAGDVVPCENPMPCPDHAAKRARNAALNAVEMNSERCPAGLFKVEGSLTTVLSTEAGTPVAITAGVAFARHFRAWTPMVASTLVELLRRIEDADLDDDSPIQQQALRVAGELAQAVSDK